MTYSYHDAKPTYANPYLWPIVSIPRQSWEL
jgi:hypothetical protein